MNMITKSLIAGLLAFGLLGLAWLPAFSQKPNEGWILHPDSDPLTMNYYIRIDKIKTGMFVTFSEILQPAPNMILVANSKANNVKTLTINSGWVVNCENGYILLPERSEQHFRDGHVASSFPRQEKKYWSKDHEKAYDICLRAGLRMKFEPPLNTSIWDE